MQTPIRTIAIVGGGLDGWISAAVLARLMPARRYAVTLIDPPTRHVDIGALDGGVASLPLLAILHSVVGLPEPVLFARAAATASLGCECADWSRAGARYFAPFGQFGASVDGVSFHHFWQRLRGSRDVGALEDYSLAAAAAARGKFAPPVGDPGSVLSTFSYAYHLDAAGYESLMHRVAEQGGVKRIEADIADVSLHGETGFIAAITLSNGARVEADLYLDCTGSRAALIESVLKAGFEDWRGFLPCDRAIAVRETTPEAPAPFRSAIATETGWRWRLPLQGSVGQGIVYASAYLSDDAAEAALRKHAPGAAPVQRAAFASGRRKTPWTKNCVAIGAAACVLDPLAPTALHVTQTGIRTLLSLLPEASFAGGESDEYNRIMIETMERMRDFIALHYKAAPRQDSAFWAACANAQIPDSLAYKMRLFEAKGRVLALDEETFHEADWVGAYFGRGVLPRLYDQLADTPDAEQIWGRMQSMRAIIQKTADAMPPHSAFLAQRKGST